MNLVCRPRRLRRNATIRELIRETELAPRHLIYPLFVAEGESIRDEISTMPGQFRLSIEGIVRIQNLNCHCCCLIVKKSC